MVGLTGASFDDEITEFLEAGVDLVLGKPFTAAYMRGLLKHFKQHATISKPDVKWREEFGRIVLRVPDARQTL